RLPGNGPAHDGRERLAGVLACEGTFQLRVGAGALSGPVAGRAMACGAYARREWGLRMVANTSGLEQAGELKMGQVGIANLRVRSFDIPKLAEEMRERVERAPKLFSRAAVVVDFGELAKTPDTASAKALLDALKAAGVLPVALAYGTSAIERLSQELGLPLLAKFRAQYEPASAQAAAVVHEPAPPPEPVAVLPSSG